MIGMRKDGLRRKRRKEIGKGRENRIREEERMRRKRRGDRIEE